MSKQHYNPIISVEVCQKNFILHRAASLEELWDAMNSSEQVTSKSPQSFDDERLPYWTELWPSSIALAQWLHMQKELIKKQICLDVGCGLGLTAMVGNMLEARILAFDYELEALHFAKKNGQINVHHFTSNHKAQPLWFGMDWRRPAIKEHSIKYLWGADIMYERKFAYPLINFID